MSMAYCRKVKSESMQQGNVLTAVRVRPLTSFEQGSRLVVSVDDRSITLREPMSFQSNSTFEAGGDRWSKRYTFDHAHWSTNESDPHFASQTTV
jgi:hypothetical protein